MSGFIENIKQALATSIAKVIMSILGLLFAGKFIPGFTQFFVNPVTAPAGFLVILGVLSILGVAVVVERLINLLGLQKKNVKRISDRFDLLRSSLVTAESSSGPLDNIESSSMRGKILQNFDNWEVLVSSQISNSDKKALDRLRKMISDSNFSHPRRLRANIQSWTKTTRDIHDKVAG